jgi:hypothetical protein
MSVPSFRALGAVAALASLLARPPAGASKKTAPPGSQTAVASSSSGITFALPEVPSPTGGPGLVVCEPVAETPNSPEAFIGTGCSMWLQLAVGGLPQLGQTPMWSSVDRARQELGRTDLRLKAAEAPRFARLIGATHVAVGEIRGTDAAITLTYRLLEQPSGKEVGEPIQVAGSQDDVVAALPGIASKLAQALGVKDPGVPGVVGGGAADLLFVGRMGWRSNRAPDGPDAERFR